MPVGNPKPQTIASERYQKKAGYISKAFKLKRDVAESFAEACEKAGVRGTCHSGQVLFIWLLTEKQAEKGNLSASGRRKVLPDPRPPCGAWKARHFWLSGTFFQGTSFLFLGAGQEA